MQTDNRFFDDFARMAEGALSALSGAKSEFESLFRQQFEHLVGSMKLVTREEFETLEAMVAKARSNEETLSARVAELEKILLEKILLEKELTEAKGDDEDGAKDAPAGETDAAAEGHGEPD